MLIKLLSNKNIYKDYSLLMLFASNIVVIFLAVYEGWSAGNVIWVYWFQSVIIGFFNFIKIISLKDFSTDNFYIDNQPAKPTRGVKIYTAFFFLFHYGSFHFGYMIFLLANPFVSSVHDSFSQGDSLANNFAFSAAVFPAVIIFFFNHFFSFIYNKAKDVGLQNIGSLMFRPYARIIPMHIIIMIGFSAGSSLLPIFLILKTIADAIMHASEHNSKRAMDDNAALT